MMALGRDPRIETFRRDACSTLPARSSDQDIDEDWTGEESAPHDLLMCPGVGYAMSIACLHGLSVAFGGFHVQHLCADILEARA